jgi:L-amino acid N-acyltransferase YncA
MNVRAATVEDLPAIVDIYNHSVLHSTATADFTPQTLEARRSWFDERTTQGLPVIVAVEGAEVLGWGALNRYHARIGYRFTVENSVYVAESAQGRGVGRALLSELVEAARHGGYHAVVAVLAGDNAASTALHARFGFVEMGRLREIMHKFDRWIDVVYLQLLL